MTSFERQIPEYISVGFIAKRCGVSNTTVLRWITTGQLPAFRLPGGHYRVGQTDFSEFLAKYNMPAQYLRTESNNKNRSAMPPGRKR
jgi:excisionase family DNA binding protein